MAIEEKIKLAKQQIKDQRGKLEVDRIGVLVKNKYDLVGLHFISQTKMVKHLDVSLSRDLPDKLVKFFSDLTVSLNFKLLPKKWEITRFKTLKDIANFCRQSFSWKGAFLFSPRLTRLIKKKDVLIKTEDDFYFLLSLRDFNPQEIDQYIKIYNLPYTEEIEEEKEKGLSEEEKEKLMKRLRSLGYI